MIWEKEVTPKSGVGNEQDQILPFQVRPPFEATFSCSREKPGSRLYPDFAHGVGISAPILWAEARKTILKGPGNRQWRVERDEEDDEEGKYVQSVRFSGPFLERTEFQVELASNLRDDRREKAGERQSLSAFGSNR
ncbi:MAG: hypothetical protein U0V70_03025 [Terriglobia bacterium]